MPTFPTYRGELPPYLNPLNLRHYFLLAYWVFFRPTALKCYLYQADPDLYRAGPGLANLRRTWHVLAYRNLFLVTSAMTLLPSMLVRLPSMLATSWIQGVPVDWLGWARGTAYGVAVSVVFGVAVSVAYGVAVSVALGVVFGVAVSVVFGVAVGVALGVAYGVALGVVFGVAVSVVFSMAYGVALGVALGVVYGVVYGMVRGVAVSVAYGVAVGVANGVGALRVPFYALQLAPALRSVFRGEGHPLEWDELIILPLPGTRRALARRLQQDEPGALRFVADAACNPLQHWAVQWALQSYLHDQPSPVNLLYALLACPDLDAYVFAPVRKYDWEQLPSIRQLLLGELNGQWVGCSTGTAIRLAERLVWALTWYLRDRRVTPLTRFAGMLYELLDEQAIVAEGFDLSAYAEIYTGLMDYPGGTEIARSFEALATFLSYDGLSALSTAVDVASGLVRDDSPIRPAVLTALDRLGQVGVEIATYRDATSRVNQLAALARATDALDTLDEYVVAEVMAPE